MQKKTGKTAKIETEHNKTTSGHMNSLNQPGSLGVFGWCAHQKSLEPPQKKVGPSQSAVDIPLAMSYLLCHPSHPLVMETSQLAKQPRHRPTPPHQLENHNYQPIIWQFNNISHNYGNRPVYSWFMMIYLFFEWIYLFFEWWFSSSHTMKNNSMATHFPRHFRPGSVTPRPDLRWRHRELCFEHFAPPQHLGRAPKRLPAGLGSIQCYWYWWELFQYVPVYLILSWSILEPYYSKFMSLGPRWKVLLLEDGRTEALPFKAHATALSKGDPCPEARKVPQKTRKDCLRMKLQFQVQL